MANAVQLTLNTRDFKRAVARLKASAPPAIARALNRAAVTTRTTMARTVAADLGIPVGSSTTKRRAAHSATEAIAVERASPEKLLSRVVAKGERIPLIDFKAKGPEPSYGRGRGVRADLRSGARWYPHSFIAKLKSGHRGVFTRVGPSVKKSPGAWLANLPIAEQHGPSIAHVFAKHREAGLTAGLASLVKNLKHEFKWALDQAATLGKK